MNSFLDTPQRPPVAGSRAGAFRMILASRAIRSGYRSPMTFLWECVRTASSGGGMSHADKISLRCCAASASNIGYRHEKDVKAQRGERRGIRRASERTPCRADSPGSPRSARSPEPGSRHAGTPSLDQSNIGRQACHAPHGCGVGSTSRPWITPTRVGPAASGEAEGRGATQNLRADLRRTPSRDRPHAAPRLVRAPRLVPRPIFLASALRCCA
jgi:hypothetical protein